MNLWLLKTIHLSFEYSKHGLGHEKQESKRIKESINYFQGHLEPSKEAGSPLLLSKLLFPDFLYEKNFLEEFWGSFGDKKTICEKKFHESGPLTNLWITYFLKYPDFQTF